MRGVRSRWARRYLRRMDRIERMSRLEWEAYSSRHGSRKLIHKGGKP